MLKFDPEAFCSHFKTLVGVKVNRYYIFIIFNGVL